jgi:hypothetical protein
MIIKVMARTFWRPILSPSQPKKTPPNGRAINVAAKIPNRNRFCTALSASGRNTGPIVVIK